MNKPIVWILASAAAFALLRFGAAPAMADGPRSEVDVTASSFSFTSPGDSVGPWTEEEIQYRSWNGADTIGVNVANRIDADRAAFAHAQNLVVDDYHDWSASFFTYAAYSTATGAPFPSHSLYVESDTKLLSSKRLVFGFGVDATQNSDGSFVHFLNVGPTYYWNGLSATLRYLPTTGTSGKRSSAFLLASTAGEEGRATTTLTLQSGAANPVIGSGALPSVAGEHTFAAQLDYKRWLSARGGFTLGGVFAHLTQTDTGALIYIQRGVSVGGFATFGR